MSNAALLERLSFGATPAELQEVSRSGVERWVQQQLHPKAEDPQVERVLATTVLRMSYGASSAVPPDYAAVNENRPLTMLNQSAEQLWGLTDGKRKMAYEERIRPVREAAASKLVHARYSRWQLRELMVDFWQNHFNVHAGDAQVAVGMPEFDRDVRRLALGNFEELLTKVAQSTPMLVYLNNRSSRTGAPNENYARELFELHTLGRPHYLNDLYSRWREVPGALQGQPKGYIDQDVYEAARAFTGWGVDGGRFAYQESWHDPYQKRVLGQEFEPFQPAMADGRRVLGLVAMHAGTAHYVCEKLCRRFVSDEPPAQLVVSAAKVWQAHAKSPDQIARVLEHIVLSDALQQGIDRGQMKKLKRPLELAMSLMRKLDLDVSPTQGLINQLSNAGQRLYFWPTPDGHPDVSSYWLTSHALRQRWFLPVGLLENWWGTGYVGTDKLSAGVEGALTQDRVLAANAQRLLGVAGGAELAKVLQVQALPNVGPLSQAPDEWNGVRRSVAYLAMGPQFQWK